MTLEILWQVRTHDHCDSSCIYLGMFDISFPLSGPALARVASTAIGHIDTSSGVCDRHSAGDGTSQDCALLIQDVEYRRAVRLRTVHRPLPRLSVRVNV